MILANNSWLRERGASLGMKRVANHHPKIQIRDCVYTALIWYSLGLRADRTWRLSVVSQRWFWLCYISVGIHRFGFGRIFLYIAW